MAYIRKTRDVWEVEVDYGGGWEYVYGSCIRKESVAILNDYRENTPQYPARMVKRREKIEESDNNA